MKIKGYKFTWWSIIVTVLFFLLLLVATITTIDAVIHPEEITYQETTQEYETTIGGYAEVYRAGEDHYDPNILSIIVMSLITLIAPPILLLILNDRE